MVAVLRDVVLVCFGVTLLVFHRPIAEWQREQWKDWQIWPITLLPTPPLSAYMVPLVVVGLGFVIVGVLSFVGLARWK